MPLKTLTILARLLLLSTKKSNMKNLRKKKKKKNTNLLGKVQEIWSLKTRQKE